MPHSTLHLRLSAGTVAAGLVVAISCVGIVRAERFHPQNSVTYTCSSGKACVQGNATGTPYGIYGSAQSTGVQGQTTSTTGGSGTSGISTGGSGNAHGVYGRSSNGQGVYGTSSTANGVEGHTQSLQDFAGVAGYGDGTGLVETGVYGKGGAAGVAGESLSGGIAVDAQGDDTSSDIFYGIDIANDATCIIDPKADLHCTGKITGKRALRTEQSSTMGHDVLAYTSETASATIEDVGTAHIAGGRGHVALDPAFASSTDRSGYYVFLTPMGDTRGLYVSAKTVAGFDVRESQGGRSTVAFDYRIVAHPLGADYDRLPPAEQVPARKLRRR